MVEQEHFPVWDATKANESLALMQQWAVNKAQERIDWYKDNTKTKRILAVLLRIIVIFFAAVGGLCPLIDATGVFITKLPGIDSFTLGKWGYVFIALAAAIVGFDKFFGLSAGWMRFIVTQLSLERVLKEFHYDWAFLLAQQQEQQVKTNIPLLQRAKDFTLKVEDLVKQETDAWVQEFQSGMAELAKGLKTEVETRKPGSIRVTVTNAKDFERVSIRLDDNQIKELIGVTEGLIEAVPPGRYEVRAVGKKDNRECKDSKVIQVQANAMASVEITLPSLAVKE
jgi:hypothetical protein